MTERNKPECDCEEGRNAKFRERIRKRKRVTVADFNYRFITKVNSEGICIYCGYYAFNGFSWSVSIDYPKESKEPRYITDLFYPDILLDKLPRSLV